MKFRSFRNAAATLITVIAGTLSVFGDAPTNDNFANAEVLTGPRVNVERTTAQATKEAGEPNHAGNLGGMSVWFKWTPTSDGIVSFSTNNTETQSRNTLLAVYKGTSLSSLFMMASSDDINELNKRSYVRMTVEAGQVYYIAVDGHHDGQTTSSGPFSLTILISHLHQAADFDGDGRTDPTVFRPQEGTWYSRESSTARMAIMHYGVNGDIPVVASRGSTRAEPAVFRPSTGTWYSFNCCAPLQVNWGVAGDIPIVESFGGDGSQFAVFRPSNGNWYIDGGGTGDPIQYQFGVNGDIPVPGRYTADLFADVAVYRPSTGTWYIRQRADNLPWLDTMRIVQFGQPGDKPVPGDYDGDGLLDPAIYRPSTGQWWMLRSSDNQQHAMRWGVEEDIPVTGDYDADGYFDYAVYRPSTSVWYILFNNHHATKAYHFGTAGDIPVTSNIR